MGDGNFPNFLHDFGDAVRDAARLLNLTRPGHYFTRGLKFSEFLPFSLDSASPRDRHAQRICRFRTLINARGLSASLISGLPLPGIRLISRQQTLWSTMRS
jgi:hypothetical protein